uniref:Uncharacterized protein n=1 Tax=Lactuca sativa TaxID=4236 RepID=A0A9R1VAE8_LACSA|nr:hypothetical protein LSAT_V11C500261530 [Lactuca sativa]
MEITKSLFIGRRRPDNVLKRRPELFTAELSQTAIVSALLHAEFHLLSHLFKLRQHNLRRLRRREPDLLRLISFRNDGWKLYIGGFHRGEVHVCPLDLGDVDPTAASLLVP